MTPYAELCVTSNFTFLTGASHPEELVTRAAELGLAAIAITDRNSLAGVVRAYSALKELTGLRAEAHALSEAAQDGPMIRSQRVTDHSSRQTVPHFTGDTDAPQLPDTPLPKLIAGTRLVLTDCAVEWLALPTDLTAWSRLTRLLSLGKRRAPKGECYLKRADLLDWGQGMILIALPPDQLEDPDPKATRGDLLGLARTFPGQCFLGAAPRYDGRDQIRLDRLAVMAQASALPMVAVGDVLMHRSARRPLADVLTCLRTQCTIDNIGEQRLVNGERRLKSGAEMARLFHRHPAALRRTVEIADRCAFNLGDLRYQYPDEARDNEPAQTRLERLTRAGLHWRYPAGPPPKIIHRVEKELTLIREIEYAPYFLTVHDIVQFARSQGILCQGRGSAANSVVCYLLGITEVPPESITLIFERFISKERGEPPDIDVDFEHERREEVIQWIYERYGRERAGLTAVVIHFRSRAATREVGKVTLTRAQEAGLPDFDLIICDEAHRTTGATLDGDEESNFVKIHSNDNVKARKRLYMTATPRIFGDNVRSKADEVGAELASMDNPALFGETLFYRGFGWAVQNGLLTDYKVIVLAMDEGLVSAAVQKRLGDAGSELVLDDATKIIGCYKALTKIDLKADVTADPHPMRRAIAFAKDIRSSKLIRDEFTAVVDEYLGQDGLIESDEPTSHLQCEIEHVDGTFNAKTRGALLDWLKADAGENTCRILTNARCLSEGVDVPALDAIMFLHPRKSQIDVVQSVGRVMRKTDTKKMGYVILPVGVPAGVPPEQALADNERYRVVWQILNALRAHDERFDSTINKMSLGQDISDTIEIVGITAESEELKSVTAVVQNLPNKTKAAGSGIGSGGGGNGDDVIEGPEPRQTEMAFSIDEFSRAIMAKIVKKCGTRDYWEDWSASIAEIAKNHITRLTALLKDPDTEARKAFDAFLAELRDDLNDSISEGDAIEMLAQHIITRPVFETLFEGHKFTAENPVSRAMQRVLDVLNEANLDKESKDLEKFYASVKTRSQGITDPQAKQKLIVELYDKFFRRAFPRTTEKLGIVYTPVEIVDFIIHSVNEVLQSEFGQTLGSPGVHIIDPFTGTGTFITRLLQSGLIAPEEMEHKFRHEIHANEIVLLAYYIAAINIEAVYHGLQGGEYVPFEGICLTDTFQMYESDDLISHYMPDNSERRKRQKATDIRVIVGNPPYSIGQDSENDNAANVSYSKLDGRIRETYVSRSDGKLSRALYDSYMSYA